MARLLFKICATSEWQEAAERGDHAGSTADRQDGFIHLSTAYQIADKAAKHFAGRADLVPAAFEQEKLGMAMVCQVKPLAWNGCRYVLPASMAS